VLFHCRQYFFWLTEEQQQGKITCTSPMPPWQNSIAGNIE
jgi:hypothetical protein